MTREIFLPIISPIVFCLTSDLFSISAILFVLLFPHFLVTFPFKNLLNDMFSPCHRYFLKSLLFCLFYIFFIFYSSYFFPLSIISSYIILIQFFSNSQLFVCFSYYLFHWIDWPIVQMFPHLFQFFNSFLYVFVSPMCTFRVFIHLYYSTDFFRRNRYCFVKVFHLFRDSLSYDIFSYAPHFSLFLLLRLCIMSLFFVAWMFWLHLLRLTFVWFSILLFFLPQGHKFCSSDLLYKSNNLSYSCSFILERLTYIFHVLTVARLTFQSLIKQNSHTHI